jgi:hypothetical protein
VNEDPPFRNYYVSIRLAGMIDVPGCIAAPAPIDGPFEINVTNTLVTKRTPTARCFNQ